MPKFFVTRDKITDREIIIDSEDAKHIKKVLRIGVGDTITVCDGGGTDYTAKISDINENCVICEVLNSHKCETEPGIKITLYQGLPKASKMDYIIQKNTELGICEITPVAMSRCVVKLENKKAEEKKTERWQKIAVEAAKQSGRGIIPTVNMPLTFDEVINSVKDYDLVFAPYECEEEMRLRDIVEANLDAKNIAFIIGPEGGFDPVEIEKLKDAGIKTVTLGKRILRTETAAEAVISMLMYGYNEI